MQSLSGSNSLGIEASGPAFFCRVGECRTPGEGDVISVTGRMERTRDVPCRVVEERWSQDDRRRVLVTGGAGSLSIRASS